MIYYNCINLNSTVVTDRREFVFTLDYQSRLPIYEQLYKSIIKMASLGVMEPNEKLPSVRVLGQQLGVNPNTVQKAYQMLERDQIIYSIPGKGSFISPDLSSVDVKKSEALEKVALAVKEAIDHGVEKYELLQYIEQLLNIESAGEET
jgi:hypothetical protein